MFRDQEEDLELIAAQQEDIEQMQDAECPDAPVVYNTDTTEVTPDELSEALLETETEKIPSLKGYLWAVLVLLLGIAGMVIYWLRLGGVL